MVARPLHRLPRPGEGEPRTRSLEEYLAMMAVAGGGDKLLITVLAVAGLRIAQALALHRNDMHLMANSRGVGCSWAGHVVRRDDNENLALSKRPGGLIVPAHAGVMGLRRLLRERDVPLAVFINDRQVGALDDVQIQNGKFRTLRRGSEHRSRGWPRARDRRLPRRHRPSAIAGATIKRVAVDISGEPYLDLERSSRS